MRALRCEVDGFHVDGARQQPRLRVSRHAAVGAVRALTSGEKVEPVKAIPFGSVLRPTWVFQATPGGTVSGRIAAEADSPAVRVGGLRCKGGVMVRAFSKLGRASSIALLSAAAWGLALVVAGFLVPVYQSEDMSPSGELTQGTETLVGMNGPGVLIALALPLLATVLVAGSLLLRSRRGALPVAWALTALLAVFNLLGMLTIGVFVVPVTAALVVACASASGSKASAATTS